MVVMMMARPRVRAWLVFVRYDLFGLLNPGNSLFHSLLLCLKLRLLTKWPFSPNLFVPILLLLQEPLRPQPVLVEPVRSILVIHATAMALLLALYQSSIIGALSLLEHPKYTLSAFPSLESLVVRGINVTSDSTKEPCHSRVFLLVVNVP